MELITLIPAAGVGTRMRPLTYSTAKAMIPVAGKPMLSHIINAVRKIGGEKFVVIVEYKKEEIKEYLLKEYPALSFTFINQGKMLGLGHACYQAREFCDGNPLLIIYGDTLFKANLEELVSSKIPRIGVFEVEDPRRFGVIKINDQKEITRFIEKPDNPPTNLAIPGVNYFPNSKGLFQSLEFIIKKNIKTKGEFQITDAFQKMIESGIKMGYFHLEKWYDCGKHLETLQTNKNILLDHYDSFLFGQIQSSKIIDPIFVGPESSVKNSQLGPYVSIGKHCKIIDSEIKNSIIGDNTFIINCKLSDSIIGKFCETKDFEGKAVLGDHSLINLSQK